MAFQRYHNPALVDVQRTRDRIYIRIAERLKDGTLMSGQYWLSLSFEKDEQATDFFMGILEAINRPPAKVDM